MKKFISILSILLLMGQSVRAQIVNGVWHNDLRNLFLQNKSIIYVINIRTFNAKDTNKNEIIDNDEESGNFLNAIERLDELKKMGINTLHILPITPVGKLKALGNAGSVYAISDFGSLNPQLKAPDSTLSVNEQAKKFITECHKRNIRVIVDLPSCGAYDLFINHPDYFVKDESGQPIIPLDWTDVRVLETGKDGQLDEDVYYQHKEFVDMVMALGADGIRADVATMRPYTFWEKLIQYARGKDPEFMFLAEASNAWVDPPSKYAPFTTYDKLLNAGFDGYYGDLFNLKNWKTSKEFLNSIKFNQKIYNDQKKTVIGSFTTHDETSPILLKGPNFSKMIIWLNATLPLNSYFVDGFPTGDDYDYGWANKKATVTYTDDEYYFNHKGKFDLFNFSRRPGGSDKSIYDELVMANKFKSFYADELSTMQFIPLKASPKNVFAYARSNGDFSVITIGNLDFEKPVKATVKVKGLSFKNKYMNLRLKQNISPEIQNGKITTELNPGDIQVLMFKNFTIR